MVARTTATQSTRAFPLSNRQPKTPHSGVPFPDGGRRITISTGGGAFPRWSRDGNELFYVAPGSTLVAVEVSTGGEFSIGDSTRLFQRDGMRGVRRGGSYDVSLDSQRFLMTEPVATDGEATGSVDSSIRLIMNWPAKYAP